jgi:TolA-binding protein
VKFKHCFPLFICFASAVIADPSSDFATAIELYQRIVYSSNANVVNSGRTQLVESKFSNIIKTAPRSLYAEQSIYLLGEIQAYCKNNEKAILFYRKLIADYNQSYLLSDAYHRLATIQYESENYDGAIKTVLEFLNHNDYGNSQTRRKPELFLLLGESYFKKGDAQRAIEVLEHIKLSYPSFYASDRVGEFAKRVR